MEVTGFEVTLTSAIPYNTPTTLAIIELLNFVFRLSTAMAIDPS